MAAIDEGMVAYGTVVSDHARLDAGTPETYAFALTRFKERLDAAVFGQVARRPTHHSSVGRRDPVQNSLDMHPEITGAPKFLHFPDYPKDAVRKCPATRSPDGKG
jgi:hypothetical protein